jgi:galactose mutarotase-like enzyme
MKRKEIEQYVGNPTQLGGSRQYVLSDGWGRNLRGIDVNSGAGLQYTILPDRGMDISYASYKGTNLVFITSNGETHPAFFEPENLGWLHTFAGGLLTTCGLTYMGAPVTDGDEQLGLHGRYSTIPAKQVADLSGWVGEEFHIKHRGIVEEGRIFGHKLRLEREIATIRGQNVLRITDHVTNFGFNPSPYTVLYHMNLGYPLLSEEAELIIDPVSTRARDETAASGLKQFKQFTKPREGYREQVFFHTMKPDVKGEASVSLQNRQTGITLTITFDAARLPYLTQWKMMGQGDYVLGLEPCNVPATNRKAMREANMLPVLQPGESVTNTIRVEVSGMQVS